MVGRVQEADALTLSRLLTIHEPAGNVVLLLEEAAQSRAEQERQRAEQLAAQL